MLSLAQEKGEPTGSSGDLVFADLTGGFGVDFSFLAPLFDRAIYIERNAELCEIARHNFPLLGLKNHEVIEGNGAEWLDRLPHLKLLMLDPARRDAAGRKTVLLEDCEPNVKTLLPGLLEKAENIIIKLSPMLDLHRALEDLRCVSEVHLVAEGGECKELLLVLDARLNLERGRVAGAAVALPADTSLPIIHCADDGKIFSFTAEEERAACAEYADELSGWLCEPNAAVLKAGGFKALAARYGLKKLHPNSHLYVSPHFIDDFPGRVLKIREVIGFSKKELRALSALGQANLTVRNFPATVDELRKKLKLREGGSTYLFATTAAGDRRVVVVCGR